MAAVGDRVRIERAYLDARGGITIGHGAYVGHGAILTTRDGPVAEASPILIGPGAWIGPGAVIRAGTRVEAGAVVPPGAVVSGRVQADEAGRARAAKLDRRPSGKGMFFVVSTGRSGTTSITHALRQHPRIDCRHEHRPQLVRLSAQYAHGNISSGEAREELRALYCETFSHGSVYGESDHHLFNLIPLLAEVLPEAKFIWLIRDGRGVVASGVARGWYDPEREAAAWPTRRWGPGIWDYYRIRGDLVGEVPAEEWQRMSVHEKNCWYWAHVQRTIEAGLAPLPKSRWMLVKLEELGSTIPDILAFLGVPPAELAVPVANTSRKPVRSWDSWSPAETDAFWRWCGTGMARWYPNALPDDLRDRVDGNESARRR